MLDHETQPSARALAQMRAITRAAKAPDDLADRLAAHPKMNADVAGALVKAHKRLAPISARLKISEAETIDAVMNAVPEDGEVTDPDALFQTGLEAIQAAWAAKGDTDVAMLGPSEAERSAYLQNKPVVGYSWDGGAGMRAKMVEGLITRLDPKGQTSAMGRDAAQMTMPQIAMAVCHAQGLRPFNEAEAVRMATHSTSDFPLILENSLSNLVARRMEQRLPDLARASHEVARDDYRVGRSLTLSATGMPQEVAEGGEVKFVTAEEKGEFLPTVRDFASGFNISNVALTNDSTAMRLLGDIGNRMTQGAVERLRHVLLEPIEANSGAGQNMADGTAMFHADHGNLASTAAAISIESLSIARTAMRKQRGLNGELYASEPWGLVVPAELETAAQKVLADINATKSSDANPFQNALELIVEPGLSDPEAWYLMADPARYDGLAHAFLDGQRAPRVETRPGWNTLGMEMRLVWSLDARFIETATWFKNAGA